MPSKMPDSVAPPSHFILVAFFGKKIITPVNQSDRLNTNGHQPQSGKLDIFQPANAQTSAKKSMAEILSNFDGIVVKITIESINQY